MITSAVIVTFNPDESVQPRIEEIARQVDKLYLIDNSPDASPIFTPPTNTMVIHNKNEGGLAGALNIALRSARDSEFDFLFLFDQDTDITQDFCNNLLNASQNGEYADFTLFGPRHVNASTNHAVRISTNKGPLLSHWPQENDQPVECFFIINSCSLIDLRKLPSDLFYDEDLGVDMIDVDFCLAARGKGARSLCIPSITVRHGIGNKREGGHMFSPTNYSSHRKYLQTRNRFITWRRYSNFYPLLIISDMFIWALDSARTLVLEQGRASKARSILRGIIDGLKYNFQHSNSRDS